MGAWGVGIRQDDFVCDIQGEFKVQLKNGKSIAEATQFACQRYANALDDREDGPLLWLALADMQWTYGDLDPTVQERVFEIVDAGTGMDRWGEPSDKLYKRRKAALENFRNKISQPNPKPSRRPKRVTRKPKFNPGDCLSVAFDNEEYGAALVLATDHSHPEHGRDLVGELDYLSDHPPTLSVFTQRRWLKLPEENSLSVWWYYSQGFRTMKKRIEVRGNIPIIDTDPTDSSLFGGWHLLGHRDLRHPGNT